MIKKERELTSEVSLRIRSGTVILLLLVSGFAMIVLQGPLSAQN